MTKELFEKILEEEITDRERLTLRIKGFIGRGINGVDARTFTNSKDYAFEIVECKDEYLCCRYGYKPYIRRVFIPYDQIMWVEQKEYDPNRL